VEETSKLAMLLVVMLDSYFLLTFVYINGVFNFDWRQ